MGMGYGSNFCYTISSDKLHELAPKEWDAMELAIPSDEIEEIDYFLERIAMGDQDEVPQPIQSAYNNFVKAIQEKTNMEIQVGYYYADTGDRYDELEEGVFWYVDNATIRNPEIPESLQNSVQPTSFVTYG